MEYLYNVINPQGGRLEFDVKAKSNAHLCLVSDPTEELPIHEIFLGGWENSKSAIRHNKEKPDMAFVDTPNLHNGNDFKRFWIEWNHSEINVRHACGFIRIFECTVYLHTKYYG